MAHPDAPPEPEGTSTGPEAPIPENPSPEASASQEAPSQEDPSPERTYREEAYPEVPPGRRPLRAAWWSLLCIPVSYVLAYLVGSRILGLLGHSLDDEADRPSLGESAAAGVPATLVMIVPGVLAFWFGLRARREGERTGLVPALLGAIIAGYQVLTGVVGIVQLAG